MTTLEHPGLALLQTAALRNTEADERGSKSILGYVADKSGLRQLVAFLSGEGYEVKTEGPAVFFSFKRKMVVMSPDMGSLELFPVKITLPGDKRINVTKFEKNYGVKVHRMSVPDNEPFDSGASAAFSAAAGTLAEHTVKAVSK